VADTQYFYVVWRNDGGKANNTATCSGDSKRFDLAVATTPRLLGADDGGGARNLLWPEAALGGRSLPASGCQVNSGAILRGR
jgi:hypothetical protein